MKTRCPCCGAENSLDALVNHDAARSALWELSKIGDETTRLAVTYVGLFRPNKSSLNFERMAKLLEEIRVAMDEGFIERDGKRFEAPRAAWIHGFRTLIERRDIGGLRLPLKGHGYLYEVIASYNIPNATAKSQQPVISASSSQTMTGLAKLEAMKYGTPLHK